MLRFFAALWLAFLASYASAATMTFTFNHPSGNFTKSYTVADAQMTRWYAMMAVNYGQLVQTGVDAQGNAITRPPTRAEVMTRWADGLMRSYRDGLLNFERNEAAQAAAISIVPITVPTIDATP